MADPIPPAASADCDVGDAPKELTPLGADARHPSGAEEAAFGNEPGKPEGSVQHVGDDHDEGRGTGRPRRQAARVQSGAYAEPWDMDMPAKRRAVGEVREDADPSGGSKRRHGGHRNVCDCRTCLSTGFRTCASQSVQPPACCGCAWLS
jgi:hypothetical protein